MKQATTRLMFAYWDALRGERAAPDRGDVDPAAIRTILADTFILELDPDGSGRFRLAGTRLCALFGGELKGRPFEGLWPERRSQEADRLLGLVIEDTVGLVLGLEGTTQGGETAELEMLLLPLRHRGKPHVRVLGSLTPAALPSWIGLDPVVALRTVSSRVIAGHARRPLRLTPPEPAPKRTHPFRVYRGGRA